MPETLTLPTTLNNRYAIERELGRWRITTSFLGRELDTDRRVAVHVLDVELARDAGERFLQQLPAIARLRHPNILPIIDFGRSGGGVAGGDLVYYVTPWVEVEVLTLRLQRERQLPLDEALRIVGGVADALDYAHEARVVHGALSPSSIALQQGETLLTDLAETAVRDWSGDRQAAEGTVLGGGPAYMSPERCMAQPLDGRSDQYSLAAVLYEMLAGQPPFAGRTPVETAEQVVTEPPRRLTALRVVPRIIERAIYRALAKSPADRFRSVGDFVAALHGASTTSAMPSDTTTPTRPPAGRRWRAAAVAVLIVLTIGAGVAMASRAVVNRRTTAAPAHRQLTFTGTATAPALSPDGRSVSYVAGGRSLIVQRLDGGEPAELVQSARRISGARWTGDGQAIVVAMTRDSTDVPATYLVPTGGGSAARKVLDDARPFDTGPDSAVVRVARRGAGLEIVSLASGAPTRTIALPDSLGSVLEVAWSPDGRWISFATADDALWVIGAAGGSPTRVADDGRRIRWAAPSDAVFFLRGPAGAVDLMRVAIDRQSGRATGDAVRVTSLLAADAFDIGRNNRLVHTQTSRDVPLRAFVFGGRTRHHVAEENALPTGAGRVNGAVMSPDGRWVAFGATRGAERDVHVVAFGGGSARVLAGTAAREEAPAWSPDGSRLAFAREDSARRAVMIADARSGAEQRVGSLPGPAATTGARWSASGRHLAYYANDRRRIALLNFQRRNESVMQVPDSVGTGQVVVPAPNGTQLLVLTRRGADDQAALWLLFGNGRRWRQIRSLSGETQPVAWHRNGWIYVVRSRSIATDHGAAQVELWRMRGPTGRPELYAPLPAGCGMSVSISADAMRGVCDFLKVESDLYVASSFGAGR